MQFDFAMLLTRLGSPQTRRAGDIIFEMGEAGDVLYVVCSGQIQIKVGDIVFETVRTGGVIGEMALLDDDEHSRSATAVALTDCAIVSLDRDRLLDLVRLEPSLALHLARLTVRRLRATNFLAHHDSLTRLPNRARFLEACRLAVLRARRRGATVGVLYVGLGQFQIVSETRGPEAGSQLMRDIGARILALHPEPDVVARIGEDEFAVLLEDLPGSQRVTTAALELVEALSGPFSISGEPVYLTASVGISCFPQDGEDATALLGNAGAAMRHAQEEGGSAYRFYSAELQAAALEEHRLHSDLRQAIGRNEFSLHFQPRIATATGRITAVEALLRWRHAGRGMVPPGHFIPVAEEAGMIEEIGEWVLRAACAQQKAWISLGVAPPRMAVNLSARQLESPDLIRRIAAILAQTGLEPKCLELEITESAVMEDSALTLKLLAAMRAMGITVALDDFGTGYSSLGYLKKFPLDYMKIDQCFVSGIPGSAEDVAIARTVMSLARNLGLKVVAEGIETAEQLAFFTELGCEELQGHYFSKAVPAAEAEALLRENRGGAAAGSRG